MRHCYPSTIKHVLDCLIEANELFRDKLMHDVVRENYQILDILEPELRINRV